MMFRRGILFVSCLFFAACVTRFLWVHRFFPFGGPAVYAEGSVCDFGTAKSGDIVRHVFRVANHGSGDLEILRVRTDCGCTAAEPSAEVVLPGKSIDIGVELSLAAIEGDVKKRVLVDTNDARHRLLVLVVKGAVTADIRAVPRELQLELTAQENPIGAVDIVAEGEAKFEVTDAHPLSAQLEVRYETVESGRRYRVYVTANERESLGADFKSRVFVSTTHPRESLLIIPVMAKVSN